jgi:hypothetical protein
MKTIEMAKCLGSNKYYLIYPKLHCKISLLTHYPSDIKTAKAN